MTAPRKLNLNSFKHQELPHLADVLSFGNSHQTSVYADSTGVKSPEVVFRGLYSSRNRMVSEDYLLNYHRNRTDMGLIIGVNNYRLPMTVGAISARQVIPRREEVITLPKYDSLKTQLGPVIRSRRSVRKYSGRPLPLKELSSLLFYSQGETGELPVNLPETVTLGDVRSTPVRAVPSGGALYPVYLYFVGLNIESLDRGVYVYIPHMHGVRPIGRLPSEFDINDLAQFGDVDYANANLLFIYGYRLYENSRKYGDLGLSFALLEAGGIAQNIHLTCTALGLGSCDLGGFKKRGSERLLGMDGISEHVIHMTIIGK